MNQQVILDLPVFVLVPAGLALLWPALRLTRRGLTGHRFRAGECQRCGFTLATNTESPCPECGTAAQTAKARLGVPARALTLILALALATPLAAGLKNLADRIRLTEAFAARFPDQNLSIRLRRGSHRAIEEGLKAAAERPMDADTLRLLVDRTIDDYTSNTDAPISVPSNEDNQFLVSSSSSFLDQGVSWLMSEASVDARNFDVALSSLFDHHARTPPLTNTTFDEELVTLCSTQNMVRVFGNVNSSHEWKRRTLTPEQEQLIASFVLRRTRDREHPWNRNWGTAFELLGTAGKLTQAQIDEYLAHAVEPALELTDTTVYAGEPVPLSIIPRWHSGCQVPFEATFTPDKSCAKLLTPQRRPPYLYTGDTLVYTFTPPATPGPFTISGTITITYCGPATDAKGKRRFTTMDSTDAFWQKAPKQTITRTLSTTCTIVVDTPPSNPR